MMSMTTAMGSVFCIDYDPNGQKKKKVYELCLSLMNADALSCILDDATYARMYVHIAYQMKNVCPGSASQCILRNKNEVET